MTNQYWILFVVLTVVSLTMADQDSMRQFKDFQKTFSKVYTNQAEEYMRFKIFSTNLKKIEEHNAKDKSWKMGINEMSDYTEKEINSRFGYKLSNHQSSVAKTSSKNYNKEIAETVDWRLHGSVTPIKSQGHCGSCWAVTATEMIESYVHINDNVLLELSAQQLTSCTPNTLHCGGFGGCTGSVCQLAFTYTQLFGLSLASDYSYISGMTSNDEPCRFNAVETPAKVTIRGYETLPSNDMEALMSHLSNVGPLAVSVDASNFHSYSSGVFDDCDFDKNININHAVQLVGYGNDSKHGLYWLIRNSWGQSFGENGYIRIKRFSETKCGTNYTPLNGTACVGDGHNTQKVCGSCGILFDTSYPIGARLIV